MESTKWLALAGAIWIMLVNGSGYNFGLYSQAFKEALNYSQNTVSTIAFFKDLGGNLGMPCGIVYKLRGPRVVLFIATCLNFVGYFVLWLIVTHRVADPGVVVVSLLFFLQSNSQAFGFTCAMITSVQNFPQERGFVIGVVTSFIGLSGAVLALVFEMIYKQNTADYLLFNAWFASGVLVFCMPLMQLVDNSESSKSDSHGFQRFSVLGLVTAGYVFVVILLKVLFNINQLTHCTLTAVLLVGIIAAPFLIMFMSNRNLPKHGNCENSVTQVDENPNTHAAQVENLKGKRPQRGENFTVWQAVASVDMGIIVLSSICGVGSVIAASDNMGQIGTAWGYTKHQVTNSVSFTSIWNFLGRVSVGWLSEALLRRYGTPRPLVFSATLMTTAFAHLFIAFRLSPAALLLASALEGFSVGALLTVVFTITSELFGLENFGTLYSVGNLVSATVGTYSLSVLLAGDMFDRESRKEHEQMCHGVVCYRESFLIMAGVCVFGSILSLFLAFRTRHFYKKKSKACM